jgi:hypothetical protein
MQKKKKKDTNILETTAIRTPNSVYILNRIGREVCYVGHMMKVGYRIREWDI